MTPGKLRTTEVILVIDHSSSMAGYRIATANDMVDKLIAQFAAEEHKGDDEYRVRVLGFADTVQRTVARPASAWTRDLLNRELPYTGGNTALRDALGVALEGAKVSTAEAVLIHVLTDGEENRSHVYGMARLEAALREAEATGRVTVAVTGPSTALHHMRNTGIPAGNFQAWDGGDKEMPAIVAQSMAATKSYTGLRASGQTVSRSFFDVDPATLTQQGVRANTVAATPKSVDTVTPKYAGRTIHDFYGTRFKPGTHYYELVKPEYLREDVDLVVKNQANGEYRVGSASVRQLLGLPPAGRIRVNPKRSAGTFTIFVQSNSNNRKLVQGQTLLTME